MAVHAGNFLGSIFQMYFQAILLCKIQKLRYSYPVSVGITISFMIILYFPVSYLSFDQCSKIIIGVTGMIFLSVIVFEGNIIKRACMGLVIYALSIILEFFVVFTFLPWFPKVSYSDVSISLHSLIMKNMYNIMYYLVYIIMGLIGKKQYYGKGLKKIFILSVILTISQSLMLIVLLKANAEGMKLYACSFIIVYSGILLISYQLTMEMFSQTIENQQRKNELEQKMLEKRYQFDYYKLAYAKGEELRDIRHDIRNQLQAMEHLLHSEKREDKKRVEQMFVKLSDRVSDFF